MAREKRAALTQVAARGNHWLLWLIQAHLTNPGLGVRHYYIFRIKMKSVMLAESLVVLC